MNAIGRRPSGKRCISTAPVAVPDASVCTTNSRVGSGMARHGAAVTAALSCSKARVCASPHANSFFGGARVLAPCLPFLSVPHSSESGAAISLKCAMKRR